MLGPRKMYLAVQPAASAPPPLTPVTPQPLAALPALPALPILAPPAPAHQVIYYF